FQQQPGSRVEQAGQRGIEPGCALVRMDYAGALLAKVPCQLSRHGSIETGLTPQCTDRYAPPAQGIGPGAWSVQTQYIECVFLGECARHFHDEPLGTPRIEAVDHVGQSWARYSAHLRPRRARMALTLSANSRDSSLVVTRTRARRTPFNRARCGTNLAGTPKS